MTGCHPALIQIAADAHWNAIAGGYKVDELSVTLRVREFLEDFWQKSSQNQAVKAILLRAAAGQAMEPNHRTAELMQRGLLEARLQPFCPFFAEVIKESVKAKDSKHLEKLAKACEKEQGVYCAFWKNGCLGQSGSSNSKTVGKAKTMTREASHEFQI